MEGREGRQEGRDGRRKGESEKARLSWTIHPIHPGRFDMNDQEIFVLFCVLVVVEECSSFKS